MILKAWYLRVRSRKISTYRVRASYSAKRLFSFSGFYWRHPNGYLQETGTNVSNFQHSKKLAILICDPSRHLQESPGPPGPKSQKSLKKGLSGGRQKSPKKYPKKSKNTQKGPKIGIFRLFLLFFGTFLQTPQKTFFETFLRFQARRARRLL